MASTTDGEPTPLPKNIHKVSQTLGTRSCAMMRGEAWLADMP